MKTKFEPTAQMINACADVLKAMAWRDTVKPIVDSYQRRALDELGFEKVPLNQSYQLLDTDFAKYLELCTMYRQAAKLHVDNPEFCPLLVAESKLRDSQRALIDIVSPITNLSFKKLLGSENFLENYKKLIDLLLLLLTPKVKNHHLKLGLELTA